MIDKGGSNWPSVIIQFFNKGYSARSICVDIFIFGTEEGTVSEKGEFGRKFDFSKGRFKDLTKGAEKADAIATKMWLAISKVLSSIMKL